MEKEKGKDIGEETKSENRKSYPKPIGLPQPLPEEVTKEEAVLSDPTGRLLVARQRYFELKQVFWKSRMYAPITTLGYGRDGIAVLYGEATTSGKLASRIVMKRALRREGNISIRRERQWIRTLRRAMHIVQEVPIYASPEEKKKLDNPPTLLLEYCQGGTLSSFIKDKLPQDKTIPSRLLWSFLLCLTRACIGMLDPPDKPEDPKIPEPRIEPIETDYERHVIGVMRLPLPDMVEQLSPMFQTDGWGSSTGYNILHFGITASNVYLDVADETDAADTHPFGVRLKLGDFGMADNIHNYSRRREEFTWWRGRGQRETIAPEQSRGSYVPPPENISAGPFNNIWGIGCVDVWLRRTVAQCLADKPAERPNPARLLDDCQDALLQMAAEDSDRYASAPSETNEAIIEFLNQYLYIPSPEPGPALGDPFPPGPFSAPMPEIGESSGS
ncbi:kinase-like domain-containing protein [Apiospora arundinis]